jgi:hypothetical protein
MIMNHRSTAAFLFTLALASAAVAQTDTAAKPTDSGIMDTSLQVTGAVVSSDANRLVVKTDNGQEMVFIITDKQVDASMFRTGDRVTASYTTLAGTGAVVTKVISASAPVTTTTTTYVAPAASATDTRETDRTVTKPTLNTTTTAVAPVAEKTSESEQRADLLPATASPMPLVALLGLLGAGGAATIRRFRGK